MTGLKLLLCFISAFICCAAFGAFLSLGNYFASAWSLCAAFVNTLDAHVHWLKYKNKLEVWYTRRDLFKLMLIGTTFFIIGTSGLVYHVVIQILQDPPFLPISKSNYIPMIWALITLKSGLLLAYYIFVYKSDYNEILINNEETQTTVEATEQIQVEDEEDTNRSD